jgi:hypothetical protein
MPEEEAIVVLPSPPAPPWPPVPAELLAVVVELAELPDVLEVVEVVEVLPLELVGPKSFSPPAPPQFHVASASTEKPQIQSASARLRSPCPIDPSSLPDGTTPAPPSILWTI